MILSALYLLLRRLLGVVVQASDEGSKDVEIGVLRHQLKVLRRQIRRPSFRPTDRAFYGADDHGRRTARLRREIAQVWSVPLIARLSNPQFGQRIRELLADAEA